MCKMRFGICTLFCQYWFILRVSGGPIVNTDASWTENNTGPDMETTTIVTDIQTTTITQTRDTTSLTSSIKIGNTTIDVSCNVVKNHLEKVADKLLALENELPRHIACQIFRDCRLEDQPAGGICQATVDSMGVCFTQTKPGRVAYSGCPTILNGINYIGNSSKECYMNGTWAIKSNYDSCIHRLSQHQNLSFCTYHQASSTGWSYEKEICKYHFVSWTVLTIVGRSISLFALCIAFASFCILRRRNLKMIIHWNFVMSLIIRNVTWFLLFGVGFSGNVNMVGCRVFAILFNYALIVTFSWMMVEGIMIHRKLESPFMSMADSFWGRCVLLGWGVPIPIMMFWAILKAKFENKDCWLNHSPKQVDYIYLVPIGIVLLINGFIFCNFVCILAKCRGRKAAYKHRNEASTIRSVSKAFVFYFSLLGLTYLIFMVNPSNSSTGEIIFIYTNVILESFQGFFICLFHCFCNTHMREAVLRRVQTLRAHGNFPCFGIGIGDRSLSRRTLSLRLSGQNSSMNMDSDEMRHPFKPTEEEKGKTKNFLTEVLTRTQRNEKIQTSQNTLQRANSELQETTSFICSATANSKIKLQH
nr:corticotropin-releasing factor receptor 2 [Ciona intestinalis]|eukprot:XP_009858716.1 corticotropin-releasing factor receptor 2 [Ciona intestinalis]